MGVIGAGGDTEPLRQDLDDNAVSLGAADTIRRTGGHAIAGQARGAADTTTINIVAAGRSLD